MADTEPRLVIIQPGQKLPALADYPGDFADWVLTGMELAPGSATLIHPHRGQALPKADDSGAIVITGSGAMVTNGDAWIQKTAVWLAKAVNSGRPVLGICFGHQLLAHALGGEVRDNPHGAEVGDVPLHLTRAAATDPLFADLAKPLSVHVSHLQAVVTLPPGARRLASSAQDMNQAFALGDHAWGVQFHPEFTAPVARTYLDHHGATLRTQGRNPHPLREAIGDTPAGSQLLSNFAQLAGLT